MIGLIGCGALVGLIGCSSGGSGGGSGDGGNGSGGSGGGVGGGAGSGGSGSGGSGGSGGNGSGGSGGFGGGGASDMNVGGGGFDLATVPCMLSLSGATPAMYSCTILCTQESATETLISLGLPPNPQPYNNWILALQRSGTSDGSGTWSSADSAVSFSVVAGISTPTQVSSWSASVNRGTPAGSYTLSARLAGACDATHDPTFTLTGTLSATLVAVAGTDATGTVQLDATF